MNHVLNSAASMSTGGIILGLMTVFFFLAFLLLGVGLPYLQREDLEDAAILPLEED